MSKLDITYASEATAMTREAVLKRKCAEYAASPKKIQRVLKKIQKAASREECSVRWEKYPVFNVLTDADLTTLRDLGYTITDHFAEWNNDANKYEYYWIISWPVE